MRSTGNFTNSLRLNGEAENIIRSKAGQKRKRKFFFSKPIKSPVVIYDTTGSEFVGDALRKITSFSTLEVREKINLHHSILLRFISLIFIRFFSKNSYWRHASGGVIYDYATLMTIQPKVVLTFIDNSNRFGLLSRLYSKAKFFAIQNGFRGPRVQDFPRIIYVTNLFCHGQETIDKYIEGGHKVNKYFIVGSLKDGLYRAENRGKLRKKFDICFISEYRHERFLTSMPAAALNARVILSYLERYSKTYDVNVCVACSSKNNVVEGLAESYLEEQFIREHCGINKLSLIPNDGRFSTYKAIDESHVAINLQSTIGLEAFSRGCKVLFCNVTSDPYYDIPGIGKTGIWALRLGANCYDLFEARIKEIIACGEEEWRKKTSEVANYFVSSEERILPQEKIINELKKHL